MNVYPFEKNPNDVFKATDLNSIQANGISIRCGNKLIRMSVTEETVISDEQSYREDLKKEFDVAYMGLVKQFDEYKSQMREALNTEKMKIKRTQEELDRRLKQTVVLPTLTDFHLKQGLSVYVGPDGGRLWSFKTVYAPKWVGNRRIEPDFAKRLVTPVIINLITRADGACHSMIVRQYMGDRKFIHYHSTSETSDCWGTFKFSGSPANTPEEAMELCKKASFLLEVINDASIANRNPRGLSRYDTLCKHLLPADAEGDEAVAARANTTNSRNERSGVTSTANAEVSENVWST